MKEFKVSGLSSFKLASFDHTPETNEFKIFVIPPNFHLTANYSWNASIHFDEFMKSYHDDVGYVDLDFHLPPKKYGFSWQFVADTVTGNLTVKNLKFYEPEMNFVNELSHLGKDVAELVTDVKEFVSEFDTKFLERFNKVIMEQINEDLIHFKSIDQLTEKIVEATGDDKTGVFGEVLCHH